MPPLMPVPSLSRQAMLRLAYAVAAAVAYTIRQEDSTNAIKCHKKTSKKRKSKSKASQAEGLLLFIAEKEINRIKNYLVNARPKQSKQTLFEEVLKNMTRLLTPSIIPAKRKKYDVDFLNKVSHFESGLECVLEIFLDCDIKSLDFTSVQHIIMNWVDSCRLSNRDPQAECLLNHGKVEGSMLRVLARQADKLSGVETIIWPHLVSGELLRVVGGHCWCLQTLILACECQVAGRDMDEDTFTLLSASSSWEDDIVKSLCSLYGRAPGDFAGSTKPKGCPNLKKLILPHIEDETGAAASSIANALSFLTKLEYIGGVPMISALMKLKNKNTNIQYLQLRNICDHDLYMRRTQPNESYIKTMLPKLDAIDIFASTEITQKLAHRFPNVSTLKVEWPDFEIETKTFRNIITLDLTLDYRCVWQLLRNIGKHCRNIKSLTLRQPTLAVSDDHEEGVAPPKLPSLEHLQLDRSSFIEFTAFKNLIAGCLNLKKLFITLSNDRNYIVDELSDSLILNVSPFLANLESFTVESLYRHNLCMHLNCVLTLATVRELIARCPNLTYIGHLDSWDVVDKEVEELQEEIRSKNLYLQIQ